MVRSKSNLLVFLSLRCQYFFFIPVLVHAFCGCMLTMWVKHHVSDFVSNIPLKNIRMQNEDKRVPAHRLNRMKTKHICFANHSEKCKSWDAGDEEKKRTCLWHKIVLVLDLFCYCFELILKSIAKSVPHKYFNFVYVYGQRPLKCGYCCVAVWWQCPEFTIRLNSVCYGTMDSSDYTRKYNIQATLSSHTLFSFIFRFLSIRILASLLMIAQTVVIILT